MVKIVTESVSDVPSDIAKELGITVLPLYVRFGPDVYQDGVDIDADEFYRRLTTSRIFPSTATLSPGQIAQVYDLLAEETDEILSLHCSHKLSATYETALLAKEHMKRPCRVEVLDSLSGIMGEGLLAIAAAEEALAGATLDRILAATQEAIPKSQVRICFDTLEYLRRGGRIGRAQHLLGSILKINPILQIKDGEAGAYAKTRSRAKAVEGLYNFVVGYEGRIKALAVEHATTPDEAEALADRLASLFPRERIHMARLSPVVGAHVGPRALGISLLET